MTMPETTQSDLVERVNALAAKVRSRCIEDENGCFNWTGASSSSGYGQTWLMGKHISTHRLMYTAHKGAIPDGLHIDHLCRNRGCCNPDHLEAVTPAENSRRGMSGKRVKDWAASKTECDNGHPYTPDSIYTCKAGKRTCRLCKQERDRLYRSKRPLTPKAVAARKGWENVRKRSQEGSHA